MIRPSIEISLQQEKHHIHGYSVSPLQGRVRELYFTSKTFRALGDIFLFRGFFFLKRWLPKNNSLVLDNGCGKGFLTLSLAQERPSRVVGCDIAFSAVKQAKSSAESLGINCFFVVCDSHHLPFANESFGSIISSNVFAHWDNPQQCINESRRVLYHNGIMTIDAECKDAERRWWRRAIINVLYHNPWDVVEGHVSMYQSRAIKHVFRSAGFKVTQFKSPGRILDLFFNPDDLVVVTNALNICRSRKITILFLRQLARLYSKMRRYRLVYGLWRALGGASNIMESYIFNIGGGSVYARLKKR